MTRIGLTLNEAKTKIREARTERFDFLGYTFGPEHYRKDGHRYLGASPSQKSVQRVKQKVGDLLQPSNVGNWEEVRDRLNQSLRGWSAYFSYGTRLLAYRAVDNHVYQRVRDFLTRRHGVKSRGTRRYSDDVSMASWAFYGSAMSILDLRRKLRGETSRKAGCWQSARPV